MRTHKFVILGIALILVALFFVQVNFASNNAEALPDNPSLSITVKGSKNIEYFSQTTLTFKVEVEWLHALPATSKTAYIAMKYDFTEYLTDTHYINSSVDLTFTNQKAEETFTISFAQPLDLPLGNVYVVQFVVRDYNETGDIQDTDWVNVQAGEYYDFSIVGEPRVVGHEGDLKEGELIDIEVDVRNTGNSPATVKVTAYVDDKEEDFIEEQVGINETRTITVPWINVEEGEYSVHVDIKAKLGSASSSEPYSEVLETSSPVSVKIKADNEIPWPYWVIFGIVVIIILVIIAIIIKTNRKKPDDFEEDIQEEK